jgi:hypothetical protein
MLGINPTSSTSTGAKVRLLGNELAKGARVGELELSLITIELTEADCNLLIGAG